MKLTRIPGSENTVKHSFNFRQSTVDNLQKYQACYKTEHGDDVHLKDMVEHMLVTFMSEDKEFRRFLQQTEASAQRGGKPAADGKAGAGSAPSDGAGGEPAI